MMQINILEQTKSRLVFEIPGEDHTLCNALKRELWNDKSVKAAGYSVDHPSIGTPKMVVETSGENPKDAVLDAIKRLKKETDKLRKAAAKGL